MSFSALLRFAPVYDGSRILTEPRLVRKLMVERGALEKVKREEPIPVVIDHDPERQVGTVREIFIAPDVSYGGVVADWYHASVELTDAPGWLKRNGGVSWSYGALRTRETLPPEVGESTVLARGFIHEVSILTPSTKPAEPLACVVWFGEERSSRAVAGEVIYGGRAVIRRNTGTVLAVGGKPLRTISGRSIRRVGRDVMVDHEDGSSTIYSGSDAYREALRDGVAV